MRRPSPLPTLLALVSVGAVSLGAASAAPVTLTLNLTNGKTPFTGTVQTSGGQTVKLETWNLYVSGVALVKADGSEQPIAGLNLVKLSGSGPFQNVTMFKGSAPEGHYKGIRFAVGVPRDLNHKDATDAAAPLSVDDGMYWAWNSGYIFSRFEGKAQVNGNSVPVAYHFGEDRNYLNFNFADLQKPVTSLEVRSSGLTVPVTLDVAKFLGAGVGAEKFDVSQAKYQQVHMGVVSDQLRQNLSGAVSVGSLNVMPGM